MAIKEKTKYENKPNKVIEIMSKEYRWEIYLFVSLALVVTLLGSLILTGALQIKADAWLIGGFPIVFGWFLVIFGGITFLMAIYPFFKPALPEIKKISWLKGKKYWGNAIRVFTFIIVLALLFLLFDAFITQILKLIMG